MRDPARIELILRRIYLIWKQQPNMRLLQLLMKVAEPSVADRERPGGTIPSFAYFHLEDAPLANNLKRFIEDSDISIVDQLAALEDPGDLFVQR